MSSHHIVREKQEPALLILGLDNFDDELLGQLLEWNPMVMATPDIAEKLASVDIKIDRILADHIPESLQSDIAQLPVNGKFATTALNYLVEQGYPSVNVVTDELDLFDYAPFAKQINLVMFYGQQKIYTVVSGFSKWKPEGDIINILSEPHGLKTGGLDPLEQNVFKTATDGFFSLQFDDDILFIAERL